MEFIKQYDNALQKAREKANQLDLELNKTQQKFNQLKMTYESHVQKLDFGNARKIKEEMKDLEIEIETKQDMINILRDSKNQGIVEAAKNAARDYYKEQQEMVQKGEVLHKTAMAKLEEYFNAIRKIANHNSKLENEHRQLKRLENVVNWKDDEIVQELGLRVSVLMAGSGGVMPLSPYLIQSVSKFYN